MSCCRITDLARFTALILLFGLGQAGASEYFVDSEFGDDSYSGMQAISVQGAGPWRTLGRIASANIQPGDRIFLKCGAVWNETPVLKLKGTELAPITVTTYGDCQGKRPLLRPISSALQPESFRADSPGWSAPLDTVPGVVFSDQGMLTRARFPSQGWLRLKTMNGAERFGTDDFPVATSSMAGADWVVRTNDYTIEVRRLYGFDSYGAPLIAKPFAFKPEPGAGYFLEGQPWMLSRSEGWAYDETSRRLFVRQRPVGTIGVNASQAGLVLDQPEHVRIQGLAIRFVAGVGLEIFGGHDIELKDLDIADVGLAFVRARGAHDVHLNKLRTRRSQQDGIALYQGANATVTDSLIEDVGVSGNLRKSVAAIQVDSMSAAVVARNRIARTGYAAIMFGRHAVVEGNVISQACLKMADCGAIYTSGARKNYGYYASRVVDNLISDIPGNLEGVASRVALTAGIYLDDDTRGIEVTGNFVEKAQRGIFSKAASSVITRNTLFDNAYGIRLGPTGSYGEGAHATQIDDNVIFSKLGQMPFLVSAEAQGKSVVLSRNQLRNMAGALPAQVWHGSVRQASPKFPDSSAISHVFSLFNLSEVKQSYACPLPRLECSNLRLSDGTSVQWPLDVVPGKALVLSKPTKP